MKGTVGKYTYRSVKTDTMTIMDALEFRTPVDVVKFDDREGNPAVLFVFPLGQGVLLWYDQDCCASMELDVVGDLSDLIGLPILAARAYIRQTGEENGTATYTFYHIDNVKSGVSLAWKGSSNGYYSESVSISQVEVSW